MEEAFGRPASRRGLRAEAVVCAARGVGLDTVAEIVERAEGTVREWLSRWRKGQAGPSW
ncbi:helix-turn-helix domain-containing protein [Actinomyces israelii]